jgi:hypothetical protein
MTLLTYRTEGQGITMGSICYAARLDVPAGTQP